MKVADALASTKVDKEALTTCLDGITLAMTANYELNLRRREAIKLQFRSEFAKALCSSDNPAGGGDTSKRVKEVAEINKNKVRKPRPNNMRGRGSPCSSCSWSRHSTVGYHQHIFWLSKPVFSEMCPSQRKRSHNGMYLPLNNV
jgi:hypothetical protein